jgi:hypothetical protein
MGKWVSANSLIEGTWKCSSDRRKFEMMAWLSCSGWLHAWCLHWRVTYLTSASGCNCADVHNYMCIDIVITRKFLLKIPNFHIILKDCDYKLTELPWNPRSGSQIHIPKPDEDPGDNFNADPYGSRSATLCLLWPCLHKMESINILECLQKPSSPPLDPAIEMYF